MVAVEHHVVGEEKGQAVRLEVMKARGQALHLRLKPRLVDVGEGCPAAARHQDAEFRGDLDRHWAANGGRQVEVVTGADLVEL